jgi:alpha-D-xyloside xylohydrolase
MSLFPYRYAAVQEASKTGMPIMRALALVYQNDERARVVKDEYLLGPDLLVAPVIDEGTSRVVYLPEGEWVDYWTGERVTGGKTILAKAPMDQIPVYARAGAVIPKIPEDVMTLVPSSESGNSQVKAMDSRRVYELIDGNGAETITDFEGRKIERTDGSLKITGDSAAHVILRWRSAHPKSVTVNGASAKLSTGPDGEAFIEFEYAKESQVAWQ